MVEFFTGHKSMFSGLVFCGDCGSKLYFAASKSINEKQEFFRCSGYKDKPGSCSIHYIRNVVLYELVLDTVKKVAGYISEYEPVFLYLYAKNHKFAAAKEMKTAKLKLEQAKKRIGELDKLIKSTFEQFILGSLEEERYKALVADYEEEQRTVKEFVSESEAAVQTAKEESVDLKVFLDAIRECTDINELTPTLVNTLIKKIEVFNSVKGTDGKKHVPIAVHFRAVGIITIPDEKELIEAMNEMSKSPVNVA